MFDTTAERVRAAVEGDADALSALLQEFGPPIERRLRVNPVWQAALEPADVMQVTYLEAFLRIGSFDAARPAEFEAWLRRSAENNLRDAVRGLQRQKQPQPRNRVRPAPGEDSLVGLYDLLGATTTTASHSLARREMCHIVQREVEALPADYRAALRLYDLQGRPIEEVAREMGRSAGAVHMLRARAHDRLRERLGGLSVFSSGA
jgi:RNA polymerase sigma-70 factor (ECF subfamily)